MSLPFYKKRGTRLFIYTLPLLLIVFLMSYLPVYGWIYSFYNYKPGMKLADCTFIGLKNFIMMARDPFSRSNVLRVLTNTAGISLLGILFSPLSMMLAILLNEVRAGSYKKVVQSLTTIPYFIGWVLVYALAFSMLSTNDGFINRLLVNTGVLSTPVNFLASNSHVWLTMVLYGVWKGLGWGAIMYLAAIAGISGELYEAARVDGAGRFKCILYITVPGLMPTFFVLLLLSFANFFNLGMEQYYVFQNAMNKNSIEVVDLYVYNQGIASVNYSFSTAVGMLKSIISIILLFGANYISKLARGQSIV